MNAADRDKINAKANGQQPEKGSVVANKPLIKKPFKKKLLEAITHDDKESITDYLIFSVLLPNLLDTASDVLHSMTDSIIYGIGESGSRGRNKRNYASRVDHVSYSQPQATTVSYNTTYGRIDTDEVVFRTKYDAQKVLDSLRNDIEMYDKAFVYAFKEQAEVEPQYIAPIDHDYGWTDLSPGVAKVMSTRDGYILKLPKPIPINKRR